MSLRAIRSSLCSDFGYAQDDAVEKVRGEAEQDLGEKRINTQMYYVYILTTQSNSMIYVGVTNDLRRRLHEHKSEQFDSFTKRYHIHKLVYFEEYSSPNDAIFREKQLKRWRRSKKDQLIEAKNPNWNDWGADLI